MVPMQCKRECAKAHRKIVARDHRDVLSVRILPDTRKPGRPDAFVDEGVVGHHQSIDWPDRAFRAIGHDDGILAAGTLGDDVPDEPRGENG